MYSIEKEQQYSIKCKEGAVVVYSRITKKKIPIKLLW